MGERFRTPRDPRARKKLTKALARESIALLHKTIERHSKAQVAIEKPADRLNERARLEAVLSYRAFPVLVSFFSLLEFVFDTFYAFERPSMSFLDFRRLSWHERFKAVVALPSGSEILRRYEELLRIKSLFRNPLTHGLTNETSLLVPVPFGGLVPVSYEHLDSSVHFGLTAISESVVAEAMDAFDGTLSYFASEILFAYYMRYVDSGFSIPIQRDEVAAIETEMSSAEAFQHYFEERSYYQDAAANRDI